MARSACVAVFAATVVSLAALSSCSSEVSNPVGYSGAILWTDAAGKIQPTTVVVSETGPEHCGWQAATLLFLEGKQFLRDPDGVVPGRLETTYAPNVPLPAHARDTGFRREDSALWVTSDAAYIVAPTYTERWPKTVDGIGCA